MIISICFLKRENAFTTFAKISYLDDQVVTYQSVEDYVKEWHRFWLPLHHTVIFISNIWISALTVKINWLCTSTLVVRTAAFKRTEKKLHGVSQTDTVEFLINERKLSMIKLRLTYILSHLSTAFNSKKLFNALPQGMASTINNFAT